MTRASHPELFRSYATRWVRCQKVLPVDQDLSPSPRPRHEVGILCTTKWTPVGDRCPCSVRYSLVRDSQWSVSKHWFWERKQSSLSCWLHHFRYATCLSRIYVSALGTEALIKWCLPITIPGPGALLHQPVSIYRASSDGCCVSIAYSTTALRNYLAYDPRGTVRSLNFVPCRRSLSQSTHLA